MKISDVRTFLTCQLANLSSGFYPAQDVGKRLKTKLKEIFEYVKIADVRTFLARQLAHLSARFYPAVKDASQELKNRLKEVFKHEQVANMVQALLSRHEIESFTSHENGSFEIQAKSLFRASLIAKEESFIAINGAALQMNKTLTGCCKRKEEAAEITFGDKQIQIIYMDDGKEYSCYLDKVIFDGKTQDIVVELSDDKFVREICLSLEQADDFLKKVEIVKEADSNA